MVVAERLVNESGKYEVIGDASVVVGMEKAMTPDRGKGTMVEFKTRAARNRKSMRSNGRR